MPSCFEPEKNRHYGYDFILTNRNNYDTIEIHSMYMNIIRIYF